MAKFQKRANGAQSAARHSRARLVYLIKVSILSAVAVVVMLAQFPLPFAPPFYQLDLSEVIVLIGGFALGPLAGMLIEAIKIALNFLINGTVTLGVGELANFIMGCSLVVPAAFLYKHKKSLKSAILGMTAGTVCLTVVGSLTNLFILLPIYAWAFQMPLSALIEMGSKINGSITGLGTFVLFATAPFNLIKGVVSSILAGLFYKRVSPILHKAA